MIKPCISIFLVLCLLSVSSCNDLGGLESGREDISTFGDEDKKQESIKKRLFLLEKESEISIGFI